MMNAADKSKFEQAYSAAYTPAKDVLAEIYDEVRRFVPFLSASLSLQLCLWFQSSDGHWTAATKFAL